MTDPRAPEAKSEIADRDVRKGRRKESGGEVDDDTVLQDCLASLLDIGQREQYAEDREVERGQLQELRIDAGHACVIVGKGPVAGRAREHPRQ